MNKALRITLSIIFVVLYILICFVPTNTMIVSALNISVQGGYTTALEDLSTDENFNIEDYPVVEDDYSLQVIQIAESSDKELFVYVYQPSADHMHLRASSINISLNLHNQLSFKNYNLSYINNSSCLYKYLVNGLTILDDEVRYYEISSIYRLFDESIDFGSSPSNDNIIDEMVYKVGKQFTFKGHGENIETSLADTETIDITNKYVGFVRYDNGFHFWNNGACDSHFVAFSTDRQIDKLYEADVYYVSQAQAKCEGYERPFDTKYWEKVEDYAYLSLHDNEVSYTDKHGEDRTYTWQRIETIEQFCASAQWESTFNAGLLDVQVTSKLSEEDKTMLKSHQWVLRFTETEYKYTQAMGAYREDWTVVSDVTILRLKFETDGVVYDLGVIDNKQSGSGNPINKFEYEFSLNDTFKIILLLILLIVIIIVLGPILPTIISIVIWIIKTVFKIAIWIISLPFKLFKKRE